jgi:hypothetical protein
MRNGSSNDKRLDRLEQLLEASNDPMLQPIDPDFSAIEQEYNHMKAAMSDSSYRGSPSGPVKIEPRDAAYEHYGGDYTEREFCELAIARGLEKRGHSAARIAELIDPHLALFEEAGFFEDEEIEGG